MKGKAAMPPKSIWIVCFIISLFVHRPLMASSIVYAYNSLNRLTNVDYGNGSVISYTYDAAGNRLTYSGTVSAMVLGRYIFYNNSAFDGNNPAANANDDGAIAPDKIALLPGQTATFANYTSYSKGINGIMVDISGLGGAPTAEDFGFKVGNVNNLASWVTAPTPSSITVRSGAGTAGSDRITIIWPDNAIQKQWLQVTVRATANTGLAADDVFYFGNAVGETGNSTADAKVTGADALRVLNNTSASAPISSPHDHNRDGKVGAADRLIVLNNLSSVQPLILLGLSGGMALHSGVAAPRIAGRFPVTATLEEGALRVGVAAEVDAGSIQVWSTSALDGAIWELLDVAPVRNPETEQLEFRLRVDPRQQQRFFRFQIRSDQ